MILDGKKFISKKCPIRKLGRDNQHYFFGYYNKSPWHAGKPWILANQYSAMDVDLTPDLYAKVGFFDLSCDGSFIVLDKTSTWNWQMGCQLQWLGKSNKVIYNVRAEQGNKEYPSFASCICDVDSGEKRYLDVPVYSVAPNAQFAVTVDYRRLYVTHETIGYSEFSGKAKNLPLYPQDDGLRYVNLLTGSSHLLVSYQTLKEFHHKDSMDNALHWISHIEINPSSSRILFLHRWTERVADETCFLHRLITINPDGSDMRLLECSDHPLPQLAEDFNPNAVGIYDYEKSEFQISHPMWKNDKQIIVWGPHAGEIHYQLYDDEQGGKVTVIGNGVLTENGHMSYSPVNQRWLLTDTYPDAETNIRKLLIYDIQEEVVYDIGDFYTSDLKKENRCDLHPRWSHDGTQVCIDSVHEGDRNMYVIDVSSIVNGTKDN